jgi:hypothetical protein
VKADAPGFATAVKSDTRIVNTSADVSLALQPHLLVRPRESGLTTANGLSMQDGAQILLEVAPATTRVSWSASNAFASAAGAANARVPYAGINGSNEGAVTASGPGGYGTIRINSFQFSHVPRTMTLVWRPVTNAAKYDLSIEYCHGTYRDPTSDGTGLSPSECSKWARSPNRAVTTTQYTFDFFGKLASRWRVTARDAASNVISTSDYVYFSFVQ